MSAQVFVINFVANDLLPDLSFEFKDTDISSFLSITLRVRKASGELILKAAVIDDAANGLFHFEWAVDELTVGTHTAEVRFIDASSKPETFPEKTPLTLIVRDQV